MPAELSRDFQPSESVQPHPRPRIPRLEMTRCRDHNVEYHDSEAEAFRFHPPSDSWTGPTHVLFATPDCLCLTCILRAPAPGRGEEIDASMKAGTKLLA